MVCAVGVVLLLAGLSACGSSSSKCTSSCKTDGAVDTLMPSDHTADKDGASSADARVDSDAKDLVDAKIDGAVACDQSIAAACASTADAGAFTFHCATTWSATTGNAYLCGRPEVLSYTCGAEHELIDTSNDGKAEYIYVFDGAGKLYAISYSTGGATHCIGGPQAFVAPLECGSAELFTCQADAAAH